MWQGRGDLQAEGICAQRGDVSGGAATCLRGSRKFWARLHLLPLPSACSVARHLGALAAWMHGQGITCISWVKLKGVLDEVDKVGEVAWARACACKDD